ARTEATSLLSVKKIVQGFGGNCPSSCGQAQLVPWVTLVYVSTFNYLIWTLHGNAVVLKEQGKPTLTLLPALAGRVTLQEPSGSLQIRNVSLADSGLYVAAVQKGSESACGFTSLVPPHPLFPFPADIMSNAVTWPNGSCSLELTCHVARSQDRNITYSWKRTDVNRDPSTQGPKLSLYLDPSSKSLSYNCTAQDTSNSSSLGIKPYQFCLQDPGHDKSRCGACSCTLKGYVIAAVYGTLLHPKGQRNRAGAWRDRAWTAAEEQEGLYL
uniref:Ig-like domain-containing protein n=1 Tax=Crocodylus porosus TaxID=8502 RepID=A0A7M4ENG3_CROPO